MGSRVVREGTVGLLVLFGVSLMAGLVVWLRGAAVGQKNYSLSIELPETLGLVTGSPVRFRGVKVGQITSIKAQTNGVQVDVSIQSAELLIPRNVVIEATQSGFIGQVTLDLRPPPDATPVVITDSLSPLDGNCDAQRILCDGDRLMGASGATFDDLIRSTAGLAAQLGDAKLPETLANLSNAAREFGRLSTSARFTLRDVSTAAISLRQLSQAGRKQLQGLEVATTSVTRAANEFANLSPQFGQTAVQLGQVSKEVTGLVKANRQTLATTLNNLQIVSQDLRGIVTDFGPLIGQVEQSKLIENLERLAANGAAASQSLKTFTNSVNSPTTLVEVTQTLNAARTAFENAQKITTDLEQLTGNTEFRQNLIKLINELSKLFSSSQILEQQLYAMYPGTLAPIQGSLNLQQVESPQVESPQVESHPEEAARPPQVPQQDDAPQPLQSPGP